MTLIFRRSWRAAGASGTPRMSLAGTGTAETDAVIAGPRSHPEVACFANKTPLAVIGRRSSVPVAPMTEVFRA